MQSQQKRVKWSRGETAEALEERTDTGITQASVELMENCIPDIYGNISRRPGLKLLPSTYAYSPFFFTYDPYLQIIPFYITETDFILIGVHYDSVLEFMRIKDGKVVYMTSSSSSLPRPKTKTAISVQGGTTTYQYRPVSFAQQNNYMLIADSYNVYKIQVSNFETSDNSFTATCEVWKFSAGWYAPNGTQTKEVNNTMIPGLKFDGHFTGYTYTAIDGTTTVYSLTETGLTGPTAQATISQYIQAGDIIQFPKIGTYLRVEGFVSEMGKAAFPGITFDSVASPSNTAPGAGTGKVCVPWSGTSNLRYYDNGTLISESPVAGYATVACTASQTGYYRIQKIFTPGNTILWTSWTEEDVSNVKLYVYGSLLTPVADDSQTDSVVKVEYEYQSLQPETFGTQSFPHPTKLEFLDQRLWAGGWSYSTTEQYSIVVGSQIARYNDLKNDYNQGNEPITVDILTKFKEKILHLVDYNGLKIMTEAYEYAYVDGKIVKQSANGSFEFCQPIVFDSLCLYIDSTGCQVKAMQYEFQNNIFNSTTINQLAPKNLVWYPFCMAQYEDKHNSTGKHLFLINREDANARVAVCNFVPTNQVEIWSRWTCPTVTIATLTNPIIHSVVNLKNGPLFMITLKAYSGTGYIIPAALDFNANADLESTIYNRGGTNYFAPWYTAGLAEFATLPNTTINVYSNGEFQFTTTTGNAGEITADLTGLTNITVGLPINAIVRSHPIDVGGKTKSIKKRIAKTVLSVHNTEPGAIIVNGKTGYMNPQKDKINFYGLTGMKDEIKYTLTNTNGAMFHLESLLMNIEYGTLIS